MSPTDLSGDANIVTCSGVRYFRTTCPAPATAERIVTTGTTALPTATPLVPHRGTTGPPDYPTTYSWGVYVTEAKDVPTKGAYRLTAIVNWSAGSRAGAKRSVEAQTLIYSPEGCADTSTHPFAAPCQPFLSGTATVGGGGWDTTGAVSGITFGVGGSLLSQSADLRVEQVGRVEGNVTLPEVSTTVSSTETVVGDGAASASDNDPSTSTGEYERQTAGPQAPGSLSLASSNESLTASLGGGAQIETISTTGAGGAFACNLQIDGKPCGFASGAQDGSLSGNPTLSMLHTAFQSTAGTATLLSVGRTSTPTTTYVRRLGPTGLDPGLVREQIVWSLPEIRIGGIPSGINAPNNWQGYWVRLRDFTATATAEAGSGTAEPTVTITGGTVDAWAGGGYDSFSVAANSVDGATIPINSMNQSQTVGGTQRRVDISGTVGIAPSIETSTVLTGTTRTEAQATIGSPLNVDLNYIITIGSTQRLNVNLSFTAGTGTATVQYVPAE
jgi:hypothetical protein